MNNSSPNPENREYQFQCPKCGCKTYKIDQIQTTGGTFSKLFNIQNKKFITKSCNRCGYTELYRRETSAGMNILDYLIGN